LVQNADGSATLRVTIPRPIYLVLAEVASDLGIGVDAATRIFMRQIAGLLEAGQAGFLGPIFESALRAAQSKNLGVISAGPPIDLSKLHRSSKTKSGFVGVYANGKGFRAMASVEGAQQYIGTFSSAEEAAWKRYLHYKEHGLPYGELEVEVERWRKDGIEGTDAELKRKIIEHSKIVGTYHIFAEHDDTDTAAPSRETPGGSGMIGIDDETARKLFEEHGDA